MRYGHIAISGVLDGCQVGKKARASRVNWEFALQMK